MTQLLALLGGLALLGMALHATVSLVRRERSRARLAALLGDDAPSIEDETPRRQGFLARRLFLAGFRRRDAVAWFDLATALGVGAGALVAWIGTGPAVHEPAAVLADALPPPIDSLVATLFLLGPWIGALALATAPWALVSRQRERRVQEVERDLPVTLELLATLGEAGLGFDAAVARLLDAQPPGAVLAGELRAYQRDALAGVPRVECFRRLAERLDVEAVTILTSALVQAEQVGSGTASVLRQQADDLRQRRRERALALAESLPIKLVLPLSLCFLPAIFVWTLGPAFHQIFEVLGQATGTLR